MFKNISLIIPLFPLLILSCEKQDDYSKLLIDYRYQASFSLPIGDSSLNIENNGIDLPFNWQVDTVLEKLDTIKLQQVMIFNFVNSVKNVDYIKQLFLRIVAQNEFPSGVHLILFFADSSNFILDSLTDEKITIEPANVDSIGRVIAPGDTIEDIEVIKEHYLKWTDVRSIIVVGYIFKNTKYRNLYKYYKNYNLKIEMGFRVDFDYTFYRKVS